MAERIVKINGVSGNENSNGNQMSGAGEVGGGKMSQGRQVSYDRDRFLNEISRCSALPSPPALASRIIDMAQDPGISVNDVTKIIGLDPAISAKLIRIANSALYSRPRKVENLRQAINRFGLNGALSMALPFSVVGEFKDGRVPTDNGLDYAHYWQRSVPAATTCQVIGQMLAVGRREELFLAGLLQDIGMLAIDCWAEDFYEGTQELQQTHYDIPKYESERLGMAHAEVGAHIMNGWQFPEVLVNAIAGSHHPLDGVVNQEFITVAKVIAVAGEIAEVFCKGEDKSDIEALSSLVWDSLALDGAALAGILHSVADEVVPLAELFEIDLSNSFFPRAVAESAKEILMLRNMQSIQEATILKQVNVHLQRKAQTLEEENRRDALTCLYNRAYLDKIIQEEFDSARENNWPLSIAFIDLDHFKGVNDEHGHHMGDQVLQAAAKLLIQATRGSDVVARYGGEEFVIVMPGTAEDGMRVVCERILNAFRDMRYQPPIGEETFAVTASIGISSYSESMDFNSAEELLRAADKAVYAAKLAGRNRMVFYDTRYND